MAGRTAEADVGGPTTASCLFHFDDILVDNIADFARACGVHVHDVAYFENVLAPLAALGLVVDGSSFDALTCATTCTLAKLIGYLLKGHSAVLWFFGNPHFWYRSSLTKWPIGRVRTHRRGFIGWNCTADCVCLRNSGNSDENQCTQENAHDSPLSDFYSAPFIICNLGLGNRCGPSVMLICVKCCKYALSNNEL